MAKAHNRIEYQSGEMIGPLIYLHEVDPYINPTTGKINRKAMFRCVCGKEFITAIVHAKNGNTKSCGCFLKIYINKKVRKHGLCSHLLYRAWANMKDRCSNKTNKQYKDYGERGISVCAAWLHDFKAFYDYMMSLPHALEKGYSIDRINNDGNYEPGNMRWATAHEQNLNKRIQKNNTSGYTGIHFNKKRKKFIAKIIVNGNGITIGASKILEKAVFYRNNYIIKNKLHEYSIQKIPEPKSKLHRR